MAADRTPDDTAATLPEHRAFVVHFRAARPARRRFVGRVEHLATGRFGHFGSLRELWGFIARLLNELEKP